jgi:hypothetical protein
MIWGMMAVEFSGAPISIDFEKQLEGQLSPERADPIPAPVSSTDRGADQEGRSQPAADEPTSSGGAAAASGLCVPAEEVIAPPAVD